MDLEKIIDDAKADVEKAIRKVVPVVEEGAKIAADVKALDVPALIADIEDIVYAHLSAAGIADRSGNVAPAPKAGEVHGADPAGITRTTSEPLPASAIPPEAAAGLADEASGEAAPTELQAPAPADGAVADADAATEGTEAPAAPDDPEGVTRAVPGPQGA